MTIAIAAVTLVILSGLIIFAHVDNERGKHTIQLLAVIGMIFGIIHDKWYTETPWDRLEAYESMKGEKAIG